jgi:hypothetical protein
MNVSGSVDAGIWGSGRNETPAGLFLKMTNEIDILERPIERIKETCVMMGFEEKFNQALPDLETFLEAEVADGETSETRLTYDGLCFLKDKIR